MKLLPLVLPQTGRCDAIDRIKLCGIICVILLHAIPESSLHRMLAPYHIGQAVPLFMMLAGLTASISESRQAPQSFFASFHPINFFYRTSRILIPFTTAWAVQLFIATAFFSFPSSPVAWIFSWLSGGYGPGSYFTPVYLQHLIVFPFVSVINRKIEKIRLELQVLFWFTLSLAIDYACVIIFMPDWLYRLFYGRYLLAVVIGMWMIDKRPSGCLSIACTVLGFGYLTAVAQFLWKPLFMYPTWMSQHAPIYLYTGSVFLALWYTPSFFCRITKPLLFIGRASYHVFLIQMIYFWHFHAPVTHFLENSILSLPVALLICCWLGVAFYFSETQIRNWCLNRTMWFPKFD
jgi:hypothetical protein